MSKKMKDSDQAWDDRALGAEQEFVGVADSSHEQALNDALELQSISIRLPKELIKNYKLMAAFHGVGYQPLMRDVLQRFVQPELQHILESQIQLAESKPRRSLSLKRKAA
jgi:predicted DNA binding CopG/RHH family protein